MIQNLVHTRARATYQYRYSSFEEDVLERLSRDLSGLRGSSCETSGSFPAVCLFFDLWSFVTWCLFPHDFFSAFSSGHVSTNSWTMLETQYHRRTPVVYDEPKGWLIKRRVQMWRTDLSFNLKNGFSFSWKVDSSRGEYRCDARICLLQMRVIRVFNTRVFNTRVFNRCESRMHTCTRHVAPSCSLSCDSQTFHEDARALWDVRYTPAAEGKKWVVELDRSVFGA